VIGNVVVIRMYLTEKWANHESISRVKQGIKARRAAQYEFNLRVADELGIPASDIPNPPKTTAAK
jgi:hypothetical protein